MKQNIYTERRKKAFWQSDKDYLNWHNWDINLVSVLKSTEDFMSTTLFSMWPQTELNNEKQARRYTV